MNARFLNMLIAAALGCGLLSASLPVLAKEKEKDPVAYRKQVHKDVLDTIARLKNADPGLDRFFKSSAGYVVFARVGKMGFIVGGGGGDGELFEKGRVAGFAEIGLASVGLQVGVQEFSQIVFFKDHAAVERFKENKFEFAANASAVIVKAGASKGADYRDGVAVFTHSTGGAMAEAALGTQKFKFTPDPAPAKRK